MGAVFAVVVVGGGTVACGGGSAGADRAEVTPAAAVAEAARHSEGTSSLRYRVTGTLPEKGRVEAEASMSTEPSVMGMRMTTAEGGEKRRLEIRFVDDVMYVGGSALASEKLDGKGWFRAEPSAWGRGSWDNNSYGVLPNQLEGNPAVQSTLLTGSKDLRTAGTETVEGTGTTHYRGTVTSGGLRAARDAAADPATRRHRIDSLDQFIALHIDGALTMDLWVDDDNRTKRFRVRGDIKDPRGRAAGERLDLTVTFLDVDRPVSVEAPPAEDTADIAALTDGTP
ncbi:hypothetical protein [Streptomyces lincolnensis]|uniref:hypothetical protein n=1 Tax=Streptomyces lincolnensis TaxID=1915 RepID=UPI0037CD661A